MDQFLLTPQEEQELRAAHKKAREKRFAYRINVVILLGTGWSYEEASDALLLDEDTLRSYVRRYKADGVKGLIHDKHKGSSAKLTIEQLNELDSHLQVKTYLTVEAIIAYVSESYGIKYSASGMTDLLHRIGFTYKKSKLIPAKADAAKQKKFQEKFDNIVENNNESDPILYMDGVHPQHNTMLAYGWIKKGEENIVKSNTGRQRININGALDSTTHEVIFRDDPSINAISTVALLEKIEATYPIAKKIYIVCDNARYYRSKIVRAFLENSRVELLFLPPYSPNLNLIERLWKFMKKKVLYNQYYEKFDDFRNAIFGFFEDIPKFKKELSTLLANNFQLLNAV